MAKDTGYCDATPCVTDGNSEWRTMVGATLARTVDIFAVVNDFGMTGPKGVARSFTRFAHRSPDLRYRVLHVPQLDETGALWMAIQDEGGPVRVGLTAETILAADSDPRLACRLMFARVDHALKSSSRSRPTMMAFRKDWTRLEQARARSQGGAP